MSSLYRRIRPLLFRLAPELAHEGAKGLAWLAQPLTGGVIDSVFRFEHEALRQHLWDIEFPNPIGLAAGLDKNGRLLRFWRALGFGYVEVGSVTAQPSKGNRRPRMFRLEQDGALINRLGLPNQGALRIAKRLRRQVGTLVTGISIAKTHDPDIVADEAIGDYRQSFERLASLGSYIALNVSCPNTADGRTFEEADQLEELLQAIMRERSQLGTSVPVLIKLSPPDSSKVVYDSQLELVLDVATRYSIDGFVVCNTASDRSGLDSDPAHIEGIGVGGLSGRPLHMRAVRMVQYVAQQTQGRVPIIGVGGVTSAADAFRLICAGASLIQIYTGLVYEGPGLVRRIKEGLVELLQANGFASVASAVGSQAGNFTAHWPVHANVVRPD